MYSCSLGMLNIGFGGNADGLVELPGKMAGVGKPALQSYLQDGQVPLLQQLFGPFNPFVPYILERRYPCSLPK